MKNQEPHLEILQPRHQAPELRWARRRDRRARRRGEGPQQHLRVAERRHGGHRQPATLVEEEGGLKAIIDAL